jgi:hypothetical protein
MKKNFKVEIKDIKGEVIKNDKGQPTLYKDMIVDALLAIYQGEQSLDGVAKLQRYKLAIKVQNDEEEFAVEDITLIKNLVGKYATPLVVGQIYEFIES